jgi:hypothetical protein
MRIIILNWSDGENDPFSYFNQQFRQQLGDLGHEVHLVPYNALLSSTLHLIQAAAPIDVVLSWQGLGSMTSDAPNGPTLWEQLGIPLVCLHGDHPCYKPANHQPSSHHVMHLYTVTAFARDANRLIPRQWPALFEEIPSFFVAPAAAPEFQGDYFILPKNLRDVVETRRRWKHSCDAATYRMLSAGADAIEQAYRNGNDRDHHEVILDTLASPIPEMVRAGRANGEIVDLVFQLSRELDQVHRNFASAFVLDALPDVPIRVYGQGWERFASRGNPQHTFHPFDRLAQGDWQYHSAFGIIDIAPHRSSLHDRTLRALRHGAGFLISSSWRRDEPIHQEFAGLFFAGDANALAAKVDAVRNDPAAHRARVELFASEFDALFSMDAFMARVRHHAAERGFMLPA